MIQDEVEMKHSRIAISIVVCVTIWSLPSNDAQSAELNPIEALKSCARTENTDERYACYDALGKRVLDEGTESSEPAPVATAVAAEAAAEKPAVVSSKVETNKPIYSHVRSCQEASDGRSFFILDSGEVWKQTSGQTRRFKDCDFDIVIRRGLLGYKMTIERDDKTFRVRRHN